MERVVESKFLISDIVVRKSVWKVEGETSEVDFMNCIAKLVRSMLFFV